MNSDFKELLQIFNEQEVEYLVVGGYAAIHYSQPRYTKDLDIWIRPSKENALRIADAFTKFGLPMHDFTLDDLADKGFQFFIAEAFERSISVWHNSQEALVEHGGPEYALAQQDDSR